MSDDQLTSKADTFDLAFYCDIGEPSELTDYPTTPLPCVWI